MRNNGVNFTERNEQLLNKYGHLIDNAKHFSQSQYLNELEENKMAILIDNAVRSACAREKVDYNSFNLTKLDEATQTGTSAIQYLVKTELAMIGKIFPNMISREFVSLQPIQQPEAKVFYNDFVREDGTSTSDAIHTNRNYANNVEYDPDDPTAIKNINFAITSESVTCTTKKLKGNVTIEVEQDLRAYHGLAAEPIVTQHIGAELTREWDRTIIQDLFDSATGGTAYFSKAEPSGLSYEDRKYWMETLYEKMIDVDNSIFKKRYRKTNYIIVPADEAAFIEKMGGFVADSTAPDQKVIKTGGRYFTGTLKNRWRVYVDPFITGEILMGYNNPGDWTETSYVFAPYEMAYLTEAFTNPNTLVKTRAAMSRAAKKAVVTDLLGKVIVTSS